MATVRQHNDLIKIVFDGNKHLNHVLASEEIRKMTMIEARYPLTRMPVCGHCEKLAYWEKSGNAYCPSCGTYTKNPITYSSYLASGFDTDGVTAKFVLNKDRQMRNAVLPNYGE